MTQERHLCFYEEFLNVARRDWNSGFQEKMLDTYFWICYLFILLKGTEINTLFER